MFRVQPIVWGGCVCVCVFFQGLNFRARWKSTIIGVIGDVWVSPDLACSQVGYLDQPKIVGQLVPLLRPALVNWKVVL